RNHTRTCFVLKCDIKKFFANIDHAILTKILERHIADLDIRWLINQVISSFHTINSNTGLPLGNLTSQLFANVYMHELDMYVKQELRVKYYIRYADDFVIMSDNRQYLENILFKLNIFLKEKLRLTMHEEKVYVKTYDSGVDFLGWVHFPNYRQIRTTTKRKILRMMKGYPKRETISSYRGLLRHGNTNKLQKRLKIS
ncbi:MAG: reverse transcriptase domain-containing protein, partial [Minisyncoccia bacterium]